MNAQPKFTPGPWYAKQSLSQMCSQDTTVAEIGAGGTGGSWWIFSPAETHGDRAADARLIASAPDLYALAEQYASECAECNGTGLVSFKTWAGGIEFDNDDQPCPDCADIRAVLAKAAP